MECEIMNTFTAMVKDSSVQDTSNAPSWKNNP